MVPQVFANAAAPSGENLRDLRLKLQIRICIQSVAFEYVTGFNGLHQSQVIRVYDGAGQTLHHSHSYKCGIHDRTDVFRHTVGVVGKSAGRIQSISLNILIHSRTSICLSCIPFTTRNSGSNHRSVGSMPCSIPLSRRGLAVHHTLVVIFCNSFTVAKCNNELHRLQLQGQRTRFFLQHLQSYDRFPLERLYTEIPASIAFLLDVSRASGTLSKLLCSSSTATS